MGFHERRSEPSHRFILITISAKGAQVCGLIRSSLRAGSDVIVYGPSLAASDIFSSTSAHSVEDCCRISDLLVSSDPKQLLRFLVALATMEFAPSLLIDFPGFVSGPDHISGFEKAGLTGLLHRIDFVPSQFCDSSLI